MDFGQIQMPKPRGVPGRRLDRSRGKPVAYRRPAVGLLHGRRSAALRRALMKPYIGDIEAWEVGAEVGNVRNNRPELIERVGLL